MFKAFMFLKYIFFFAVDGGVHKVAELICFSWWLSDLRSFPPPPKKKISRFLEDKNGSFFVFCDHWHRKCKPLIITVCKNNKKHQHLR